ncbi:MAG TPA: acylphosphatase [Burkholderiales bacterium]
MNPVFSAHLRISGRVQGVGYRQALRRRALEAGATGWVRNRSDGTVEARIEGSETVVRVLIEWARVGPPAAQVARVEVETSRGDGPRGAGFEARPTV